MRYAISYPYPAVGQIILIRIGEQLMSYKEAVKRLDALLNKDPNQLTDDEVEFGFTLIKKIRKQKSL